ncbi:MAG: hypothetical protein ACRDO7_16110 [Nocardioidaceae bacterium]
MTDRADRLWHVTVTVSGAEHEAEVVREAMSRLGEQHAFLHAMRYATDRAEVAYWEQAPEMLDAAAMALRVWNEHRATAGLPAWEVVGLEVLERETFLRRSPTDRGPSVGLHRPAPTPFTNDR